jgi:hypothetical protein
MGAWQLLNILIMEGSELPNETMQRTPSGTAFAFHDD